MNPEHTQEPSLAAGDRGSPANDTRNAATVVVHGELVRHGTANEQTSNSPSKDAQPSNDSSPQNSPPQKREKPARKEVSEAKVKLQNRLPALEDDANVGVQKDQIVIRDGKADLAFTGALLASAAPSSAPKGQWQEYRIYETSGGKHVFYKINRTVFVEDKDTHEAEVFDPAPSSAPAQLLRSARDLTRSHPLTWMDAAVAFFGYDPLAKALYRKLSGDFEEHIT